MKGDKFPNREISSQGVKERNKRGRPPGSDRFELGNRSSSWILEFRKWSMKLTPLETPADLTRIGDRGLIILRSNLSLLNADPSYCSDPWPIMCFWKHNNERWGKIRVNHVILKLSIKELRSQTSSQRQKRNWSNILPRFGFSNIWFTPFNLLLLTEGQWGPRWVWTTSSA